MNDGTHTLAGRMQLALAERRGDLGLSQRALARFSGVAATTIRNIERGSHVHPERILAASRALTELELHVPPAPLAFEPHGLAQPERAGLPQPFGDVDRHGDVIGDAA